MAISRYKVLQLITKLDCEQLLRSHFVSELSPQLQKIATEKERRRRKEKVNINCKLINDETLYLINEMILESRFHKHLSLDNYSEYNDETLQKICKRSINNCNFLSTIPCFIDHENQLHEF